MNKTKQDMISRLIFSTSRSRVPKETVQEIESSKRADVRDDYRYTVSTSVYINTLPFAVTVVEPSGKRFQVQPRKHHKYKDVFVIRKNIRLDYLEHMDMVNWMVDQANEVDSRISQSKNIKDKTSAEDPENYFSLYHLAKEFGQQNKPAQGWAGTSIWRDFYEDYIVANNNEFDDRIINGERVWAGEIYHAPTAILISSQTLRKASLNPNDPLYTNQERIEVMEEEGRIKFQDIATRFELIASDHNYLPKFIKIGDRIEKLIPKKDPSGKRQDGVYFTYLIRDGQGTDHFVPTVEYCPIDEIAERYGIYNTWEEANNHGFQDKKTLNRLEELEQKHNVLVQERDNMKIQTENAKAASENKVQQLQQRLDAEKSQREELQRTLQFMQKEREFERDRQERIETSLRKERDHALENEKNNIEQARLAMETKFDIQAAERRHKTETMKFVSGSVIAVLGLVTAIFAFAARKK